MPPIVPPIKVRPQPGPPVNAASTDDTPAVQGTSLTSLIQFEEQLGGAVGVIGTSGSGVGVMGQSTSNWGVGGTSQSGDGVAGVSHDGHGVHGTSTSQVGVMGESTSNWGVLGTSGPQVGVMGQSQTNNGVEGTSVSGNGVSAVSQKGTGLYAQGTPAGRFEGDVEVTGDIRLINAGDCAEDFDLAEGCEAIGHDPDTLSPRSKVEPGTVMVLDDNGAIRPSTDPYDKRVAGVVPGAGAYKSGIILDRRTSSRRRIPVALLGKVYCNVDADQQPIRVGDLLTTSPRPGYAMKACDPVNAFGAVLGKALCSLSSGQAQIPILVTLQ